MIARVLVIVAAVAVLLTAAYFAGGRELLDVLERR